MPDYDKKYGLAKATGTKLTQALRQQILKIWGLLRRQPLAPVTPVTWGTKRKAKRTWGTSMDYSLPKYSSTKDPGLPPASNATSEKMSTGDGGKDKHTAPTSGGDGKYPE